MMPSREAEAKGLPEVGSLSLEESGSLPPQKIAHIQKMAESGIYEIRGAGGKRRVPSFDDLSFLTASISRYPL